MKVPAIVARCTGVSQPCQSTQRHVTARCVGDGVHCGHTASKTKNFASVGRRKRTIATRKLLSFISVKAAGAWRTGARPGLERMVDIMVRSICVWPSLVRLPLSQLTISMDWKASKPYREMADASRTYCGLDSTANPSEVDRFLTRLEVQIWRS